MVLLENERTVANRDFEASVHKSLANFAERTLSQI